MTIKTKFKLMFLPVAIATLPIALILGLFEKLADWYNQSLTVYEDWCQRKSKMIIRDKYGIWIYNPNLKEKDR